MELMDSGSYVEFVVGETGSKELIVTSLNYTDTPIIRYSLGDIGYTCSGDSDKYEFKLTSVRKNDFIRCRDNRYIEPNVITDSMIFISSKLGMVFEKYKVIQNDYNKFQYMITEQLNDKCEYAEKLLGEYLSELLGEKVDVEVNTVEPKTLAQTGKYRYFEVAKDIQNNETGAI